MSRLQREHRPEWVSAAWQHVQRRRVERVLAGIVHQPDRRTRASWPRTSRPPLLTLHVTTCGQIAFLEGDDIPALLDAAGMPRLWNGTRRSWWIPADRAVELMTFAEWQHRRIVTEEQVEE